MKKALVILLILAVAGGLFAQDVKVGGQIKTGLLIDAPNGTKGQTVGLYNDGDDGYVTRLDLNFSLTKEDYGVVVGLRNDWLGGPDGKEHTVFDTSGNPTGTAYAQDSTFGIYNAYVWADFAKDLVKLTFGVIDDGVWKTEGDEGFGVATGNGLRVEVKPITGLNAGIFLTVPDAGEDYGPYEYPFKYFLPETAIGAGYEADLFNVALGVKFDSNGDEFAGDNPTDGTGNGFDTAGTPPGSVQSDIDEASRNGGQRAYLGFSVKAIENLKLVFEGQLYNLGAYSDVGFGWLDEVVEYATGKITAGLVATQYFYSSPLAEWAANDVGGNADEKASFYLKFKPYGEYAVNDAVAVGVGIPFAFWKNAIKYDISVEPYVTYKLADTASIGLVYKWNVAEKDNDDANPDYNQKVQINFNYSF